MAAVDPGAIYNEQLANLNQQVGFEEGKIAEQEGFLRANVGYAESQITRGEPGAYNTEANRANKGGILSSGINAQRKTTLAGDFAAKRTANQLKLTQGLSGFQKAREGNQIKRTQEAGKYTRGYTEAENALQAANPTVPPLSATVPAGTQVKVVPSTGQEWYNTPSPPPIKWSRNPKVREQQERKAH